MIHLRNSIGPLIAIVFIYLSTYGVPVASRKRCADMCKDETGNLIELITIVKKLTNVLFIKYLLWQGRLEFTFSTKNKRTGSLNDSDLHVVTSVYAVRVLQILNTELYRIVRKILREYCLIC